MKQERKDYLQPIVIIVLIGAFGLGVMGGLLFSPHLNMLDAQEITLTQAPTTEPTRLNIAQLSEDDYRITANAYYNAGNYEEAAHYYTYAIARNPNNTTYYLNRGLSYAHLLLLPLADQDYEQAIELGAESSQVSPYFNHLGAIAIQQAVYSPALTYLYRSAELEPTNTDSYYQLAQLYESLGYTDIAENYYEFVISLNPEIGHNILVKRGIDDYHLGNIAAAIDQFDEALIQIPNSSIALRYRARCYYGLGFSDLALEDFLDALEFNPADPAVYHDLGWYYIQEGDNYLANAYVVRAQELQTGG